MLDVLRIALSFVDEVAKDGDGDKKNCSGNVENDSLVEESCW